MIETVIYEYLNNTNAGLSAPCLMEIPQKRPDHFFLVEKTGGSMTNHLYHSTIAIQSYAKDAPSTAATMNEEVKRAMLYGILDRNEIVSVQLNSDYNFTDTEEKTYRYQAVFDIIHY